jgi:hypothetical protein
MFEFAGDTSGISKYNRKLLQIYAGQWKYGNLSSFFLVLNVELLIFPGEKSIQSYWNATAEDTFLSGG